MARSFWVGWALNPMAGSLGEAKKEAQSHTEDKAAHGWRWNPEWRQPRTTSDGQLPSVPRVRGGVWEGFSARAARRSPPCRHLDFRLLAS